MKLNKKTIILTNIVCFIPLIAGLILYPGLPELLPAHWNIQGEVDSYVPKIISIIVIPLIMLVFNNLIPLIIKADPKNKNMDEKLINLSLWIAPSLNLFISIPVFGYGLGYKVSIDIFIFLLLILIFIVFGNYLPKASQSYTIGIKLPWTLNDEENWDMTHQFTGRLWVIGGFIMLLLLLLNLKVILLIVMLLVTIIPCLYSYYLYKKKEKNDAGN